MPHDPEALVLEKRLRHLFLIGILLVVPMTTRIAKEAAAQALEVFTESQIATLRALQGREKPIARRQTALQLDLPIRDADRLPVFIPNRTPFGPIAPDYEGLVRRRIINALRDSRLRNGSCASQTRSLPCGIGSVKAVKNSLSASQQEPQNKDDHDEPQAAVADTCVSAVVTESSPAEEEDQ